MLYIYICNFISKSVCTNYSFCFSISVMYTHRYFQAMILVTGKSKEEAFSKLKLLLSDIYTLLVQKRIISDIFTEVRSVTVHLDNMSNEDLVKYIRSFVNQYYVKDTHQSDEPHTYMMDQSAIMEVIYVRTVLYNHNYESDN